MSMTDPIADMLTRIRNAQTMGKPTVSMPSSKVKVAIAKVLKDEGYIDGFKVAERGRQAELEIALKYFGASRSSRASSASAVRPAHLQAARTRCRKVMNGLGIAIVSTSAGVMTDAQARATGVGRRSPLHRGLRKDYHVPYRQKPDHRCPRASR